MPAKNQFAARKKCPLHSLLLLDLGAPAAALPLLGPEKITQAVNSYML